MERCQQCGSELERAAPFCSYCGSPLRKRSAGSFGADAPTTAAVGAADAPTYPSLGKPFSQPASYPSSEEGRFAPGTLIAERYRIISLLGRGGMGEVFRADDLTLGQPVALKFLPESMIDSSMLERFRNEVRIARRIAHPNVCRVYDIGETNNQVFLSMEYVDGEDLSSLLRRSRLPRDKALEIARKICAGLAAAHDKGVLHRDLKPSNIMVDARGGVLIMDFGLAALAHEIEDVRSGTPAYMAPEQLAGKEVTARSDIYALGLVLYELFTGKPVFEGKTHDEIMRVRRESSPHRPSTLVRDLDPAVEMVILRCLEEEPEDRPSSALIVSAALPGGEYLIALYRPDDYDPSVETEAMEREIDVLNEEMVTAGVRVFVGGLSSPNNARSLRTQDNGELLVTDGPYTETEEHVIGFWVLKAADMNEALTWARKAAIACRASVEVRPFDYPK